jgi:CheY-like chemotaxis protein
MIRKWKPLIMAVDSDSDTLTLLYSMLDGEGYQVATRRSAIDALRFAATRRPEVAIIGRPESGGDGTGLARQLREISPGTQIIRLVERVTRKSEEGSSRGGTAGRVRRSLFRHGVLTGEGRSSRPAPPP